MQRVCFRLRGTNRPHESVDGLPCVEKGIGLLRSPCGVCAMMLPADAYADAVAEIAGIAAKQGSSFCTAARLLGHDVANDVGCRRSSK